MPTVTISSPHAHDNSSVSRLMLHVCIALTPVTLLGFYLFGLPSVILFILTISSALFWESLCLKLLNKNQSQLWDGSAVLTGWLLALSLPPWAPWWIAVGGSFVAIAVGKQLYGGIGQNVFNPAMLARVALLISFPVQMTTWVHPLNSVSEIGFLQSFAIIFELQPIPDGLTGATALGHLKTELSVGHSAQQIVQESFSLTHAFFGNTAGSLGETSAILLLMGGAWLLIFRVITWHIPVSMLAGALISATLCYWINPDKFANGGFHLLSGGLVLGAFFIATDLVTSPSSKLGQLIFGAGCGVLDIIIRIWGGFPEGIGFAVLFMNALTPLIDIYFKPRVYGRYHDGRPKSYSPKTSQESR